MYFRTLTNEELLLHVENLNSTTELEKELARRFMFQQDILKESLEEALVELQRTNNNYDTLQEDYEDCSRENSYLRNRVDELQEKLDVFIPQ